MSVLMWVSSWDAAGKRRFACENWLQIERVDEEARRRQAAGLEEDADGEVAAGAEAFLQSRGGLAGRGEVVGRREDLAGERAVPGIRERDFDGRQRLPEAGPVANHGGQLERVGTGN